MEKFDNIRPNAHAFTGGKQVFTIPFHVTNKVYSEELGLLNYEEEAWDYDDQFDT
ncbi:MAG: hypothetical protein IPJ13_13100 [Saprospiraceae bacterium]|nr:hypothetical protein [Saprospiraceae bacterium]